MFWGLIMEPHRRYSQTVKKGFHISMAALDLQSSDNNPAQVMLGYEGKNYLLCTLRQPDLIQCALDLNFDTGTQVTLASNGNCNIHLTGYVHEEPLEEELDEEDTEDEDAVLDDLSANPKKRALCAGNGPPTKKPKGGAVTSTLEEDDEDVDEEEDEDFEEEADEEEDEEDGEEEEDELEEEEDELEEEEDDEDEEEEEEDDDQQVVAEPKKKKVAAVNGVAKKEPAAAAAKVKKEEKVVPQQKGGAKRTLAGGVIIEDLREGQGKVAKVGKFVSVYYEGRLKSNNKLFDSATKGAGFSFKLGGKEVIKGWDVGVVGMKQGGKRRIICPPNMAYGPRGCPPAIPANATLVFDVELRKAN